MGFDRSGLPSASAAYIGASAASRRCTMPTSCISYCLRVDIQVLQKVKVKSPVRGRAIFLRRRNDDGLAVQIEHAGDALDVVHRAIDVNETRDQRRNVVDLAARIDQLEGKRIVRLDRRAQDRLADVARHVADLEV